MRRALCVLVLLFGGCAATEESRSPREVPELVSMTPLPLLPQNFIRYGQDERRLHTLFCLRTDGSVADVRLLSLTGDSAWDKSALDSMRKWRFAPLTEPIDDEHLWVRRELVVKAADPIVMSIGELTAKSLHDADSLYALLRNGTSFDKLAQAFTSDEQWSPQLINIACYPSHVRMELLKLDINEITEPMRLGNAYVIYKRYAPPYASGAQLP